MIRERGERSARFVEGFDGFFIAMILIVSRFQFK
jgi:hypothetical protein